MLSIIICSRSEELFEKVSQNVAQTAGVPYEIIRINNAAGELGICAAYNQGAQQSKYALLCFMHEDILFHTPDWGKIVVGILARPEVGLLGVTGSKYLVDAPAPWWGAGLKYCRRNVLEHYEDGSTNHIVQNPDQKLIEEVIAIDGLWMCARKEVWAAHPFDELYFPYFHIYDIDFSVQIAQHYKVLITYDIVIEHFSGGSLNKPWIAGSIAFYEKWKSVLPLKTADSDSANNPKLRGEAFLKFCDAMIAAGSNRKTIWKYLRKSLYHNRFDRRQLWMFKAVLFPKRENHL